MDEETARRYEDTGWERRYRLQVEEDTLLPSQLGSKPFLESNVWAENLGQAQAWKTVT